MPERRLACWKRARAWGPLSADDMRHGDTEPDRAWPQERGGRTGLRDPAGTEEPRRMASPRWAWRRADATSAGGGVRCRKSGESVSAWRKSNREHSQTHLQLASNSRGEFLPHSAARDNTRSGETLLGSGQAPCLAWLGVARAVGKAGVSGGGFGGVSGNVRHNSSRTNILIIRWLAGVRNSINQPNGGFMVVEMPPFGGISPAPAGHLAVDAHFQAADALSACGQPATLYRTVSGAAPDMKSCIPAAARKQAGYARALQCGHRPDRSPTMTACLALPAPAARCAAPRPRRSRQ